MNFFQNLSTEQVEQSIKRLIEVLNFQAESKNIDQQDLIAYNIMQMLNEHSEDPYGYDLEYETDAYGNHYIVKTSVSGITPTTYPCVVAHLDQVHDYIDDYEVFIAKDNDIVFAMGTEHRSGDYVQQGIGGDDLVGVWLCLEALIRLDNVKVVLFLDEEVGCLGSSEADIKFFKDCSFILQGDRRGDTKDWIEYTNSVQVASKDFKKAISPILKDYGYSFNDGSMTDVGELVINGAGCVAANISCGYFNAHFETEVVSISDALLCLDLIFEVVSQLGYKRWEHEAEYRSVKKGWGKDWEKYYQSFEPHIAEEKDIPLSERYSLCPYCQYDSVDLSVKYSDDTHDCIQCGSPVHINELINAYI